MASCDEMKPFTVIWREADENDFRFDWVNASNPHAALQAAITEYRAECLASNNGNNIPSNISENPYDLIAIIPGHVDDVQ